MIATFNSEAIAGQFFDAKTDVQVSKATLLSAAERH